MPNKVPCPPSHGRLCRQALYGQFRPTGVTASGRCSAKRYADLPHLTRKDESCRSRRLRLEKTPSSQSRRSRCILGASLEDAQMKILVHLSYQVRYLIAAVGAGFLLASATLAQSTFGSITGVVTDGSGGVTPGAEVSVTNSGTGAARKLTTGATGVFNVPNLDLGTYVLRVSAK